MDGQKSDNEDVKFTTLEHTDAEESFRQLWWTIGVTVVGLVVAALFYL